MGCCSRVSTNAWSFSKAGCAPTNSALRKRCRCGIVADASPQIKNAVDRAGRFLSSRHSLVSVLLCAIAVAMSARRYVSRHLDTVALLKAKTLGATRGFTLALTLFQLLVIAVMAAVFGSAIGYVAQEWLVRTLRSLLATATALPPASLVCRQPLALSWRSGCWRGSPCRRYCSYRGCRRFGC